MRIVTAFAIALIAAACSSGGPASSLRGSVTPIYVVQGSGKQSPLVDRHVTVVGVVTGDFQRDDDSVGNDLGGFFVQQEIGDGDPMTSDGVFVFDDRSPVDVNPGDRVSVYGRVVEFHGETQIRAMQVTVVGKGSVSPREIHLPAASGVANKDGIAIADWEACEGMLVSVAMPMTVVDIYNLERFGALTLAAGGPIVQFTNAHRPDVEAYRAHQDATLLRSLILDDGASVENRMLPRYLFPFAGAAAAETLRLGDQVTELRGVFRYSRGSGGAGVEAYRLMPVSEPRFLRKTAQAPERRVVGGSIRAMSLNALNFFTTPDNGERICGPNGQSGCRGADDALEFERQRDKLVTAILSADVHVVGLMEIENNPSASLSTLVDALNSRSDANWAYIDTGVIGSDAIRVGLVNDSAALQPLGRFAVLDQSVDSRFDDAKNRPALAQTFSATENGGRFTVSVNHLKSKGSPCDDVGDPDRGDGQGNCNATRRAAAIALADWIESDPTGSADHDVLIIGDMNAYLREDPLVALQDRGFLNLLQEAESGDAYTFSYRGALGALDHALVSPSLRRQVTGVTAWHINADESPLLDYNLDSQRSPLLFSSDTPIRASDHDPVIVGLELSPD